MERNRSGDNRAGACLPCAGSCTDRGHGGQRWRLAVAHTVARPVELCDLSSELPARANCLAGSALQGWVQRDLDADLRGQTRMRTLFLQAPSFEGFDGG